MLKNSWLFFVIVLFVSCISLGSNTGHGQQPVKYVELSMQQQGDAGLWVSGPLNGRFIIIGVSSRLSNPNEEVPAAKQDAARKAAMYHGTQGSFELTNSTGTGGFFDFSADSKLDLQYDPNYAQYIERLTFDPEKDVMRIDGATMVRFQYNISNVDINYIPKISSDRPLWVNSRNLPEFTGYTTAVGHAGKRSQLKDTVNASCDSAVASLIQSASTQVTVGDSSGLGLGFKADFHTKSEGRLMNFTILEFWINPENKSVSTLAIARVSK